MPPQAQAESEKPLMLSSAATVVRQVDRAVGDLGMTRKALTANNLTGLSPTGLCRHGAEFHRAEMPSKKAFGFLPKVPAVQSRHANGIH